jgi:hypothetical protein
MEQVKLGVESDFPKAHGLIQDLKIEQSHMQK